MKEKKREKFTVKGREQERNTESTRVLRQRLEVGDSWLLVLKNVVIKNKHPVWA